MNKRRLRGHERITVQLQAHQWALILEAIENRKSVHPQDAAMIASKVRAAVKEAEEI